MISNITEPYYHYLDIRLGNNTKNTIISIETIIFSNGALTVAVILGMVIPDQLVNLFLILFVSLDWRAQPLRETIQLEVQFYEIVQHQNKEKAPLYYLFIHWQKKCREHPRV